MTFFPGTTPTACISLAHSYFFSFLSFNFFYLFHLSNDKIFTSDFLKLHKYHTSYQYNYNSIIQLLLTFVKLWKIINSHVHWFINIQWLSLTAFTARNGYIKDVMHVAPWKSYYVASSNIFCIYYTCNTWTQLG